MDTKVYRYFGINTAMELLRPGAKWEISNGVFTRWEDERPCPSMDEVNYVMDLIREFEDKIPTMWTKAQLAELQGEHDELELAMEG